MVICQWDNQIKQFNKPAFWYKKNAGLFLNKQRFIILFSSIDIYSTFAYNEIPKLMWIFLSLFYNNNTTVIVANAYFSSHHLSVMYFFCSKSLKLNDLLFKHSFDSGIILNTLTFNMNIRRRTQWNKPIWKQEKYCRLYYPCRYRWYYPCW